MKNLIIKKLSIAFLIISCFFVIYNCDDSGLVNNNADYCISGKISNWSLGNKTLHAYLRNNSGSSFSIANCPINSDGSFNLCLPASAPDSALYTSDSIFYIGCSGGNVTFNPPDVKGTEISSFKVKSGDNVIGFIRCTNYDMLYAGAYSLMYLWVNKDVTVSGIKLCSGDSLRFNGSATSGWNKIVKTYVRITPPGYTINYGTEDPGSAVWKYTSY